MGMWIGRPGALRDIADGAVSYDRTPDLGVAEFRALSGAVTTWAAPVQPRRLQVAWTRMLRADWAHLDRLARRVDGPGPVVVVDPLSDNLLTSSQASGQGSTAQWSTAGSVALAGLGGPWDPVTATVTGALTDTPTLTWNHPTWTYGYPVAPGQSLTWYAPDLATVAEQLRLSWFTVTGAPLTAIATAVTTRPMVVTVPADAAYVRPSVRFLTPGAYPIGPALLRIAQPADTVAAPAGVERLTGAQLTGKSPTTQWTVSTELALALSGTDVVVNYKGVGPGGILRFKAPLSMAGYAVIPGDLVTFTLSATLAAIGGASKPYLEFLTPGGQPLVTSAVAQCTAPPGAAFAVPAVQWAASTATGVKIGACSLTVAPRPLGIPAPPAGEGTPPFSVTDYAQGTVPGFPDTRDISLTLVEVTSAAG